MSWLGHKKDKNAVGAGKPQELSAAQPKQVPETKELKVVPAPPKKDDGREVRLYEVKRRIHHVLLERLDLSALEELDEQVRAREIRQALGILLERNESTRSADPEKSPSIACR